jgi:hypothetical protein
MVNYIWIRLPKYIYIIMVTYGSILVIHKPEKFSHLELVTPTQHHEMVKLQREL